MTLKLNFFAKSDRGLIRDNNEDSGYAGPHLLILADGMGGHAAGEVASELMVNHLEILDQDPGQEDTTALLEAAAEQANEAISDHVKARRGARLADADLFNADIWVGQGAVDVGLVGGVAHLVPKMKEIFGEKVALVPLGQKRGLLGRFGLRLAEDALQAVEDRAAWGRFGL